MYQLTHDNYGFEITIEPMSVNGKNIIIPGKVVYFNNTHYVSDDRKILREFAYELKQKWIDELKYKLLTCENMKIKNKYK